MLRRWSSGWGLWLTLAAVVLLAPAWVPAIGAQSPTPWSRVDAGVSSDLYSVHFASPTVGYIAGGDSTILRTPDGGATWVLQGFRSARRLWSIRALTETRAWAVGDEGTITFTSDANSWQAINSGTRRDFFGLSLVAQPESPTSIQYGMLVGAVATARQTDQTGRIWSQSVPLPFTSQLGQPTLYAVHLVTGSRGVIAADRALYYLSDFGAWNVVDAPVAMYSVHAADESTFWAVGANGTIMRSTDGGVNWSAQSSGTTATLYGVYFADLSTGWAVGSGGTILSTLDGGVTWLQQQSGLTDDLRAIWFTSATEGWVVGVGGIILHTTTAGQSPIPTPTTAVSTPTVSAPTATSTPRPAATRTPIPIPQVFRVYLPSVHRAFTPR